MYDDLRSCSRHLREELDKHLPLQPFVQAAFAAIDDEPGNSAGLAYRKLCKKAEVLITCGADPANFVRSMQSAQ